MRFWMLFFLAGCAGSSSLDGAIITSNTIKHLILAADPIVAPVYTAAAATHSLTAGDDDALYHEQMAIADAAVAALAATKNAAQVYWVAVSQWQSAADGGGLTAGAAACLEVAVTQLAHAIAGVSGGAPFYGAFVAVAAELHAQASGADCVASANAGAR